MDTNTPHGGDFRRPESYQLKGPGGDTRRDPWEIHIPQDDRVPGADVPTPRVEIDELTDYEKFVIIGDLIEQDRGQIRDVGVPLYDQVPGDIMPPPSRAPSGNEIQARGASPEPRPFITPGEGIDSTKGFLGDLRAAVNHDVHGAGDIQN